MITSKYFCLNDLHEKCQHDWDVETGTILSIINTISTTEPFDSDGIDTKSNTNNEDDEKDIIIARLLNELRMTRECSESYWQQKLASQFKHTSMKREILGHHRFVTDLSNANVLIEVKNQKDVRTAIGQVGEYKDIKRELGHPTWFVYILLFGDLRKWSPQLWRDRSKLCAKHGIRLRWLSI